MQHILTETLEAYLLQLLKPASINTVEEHLMCCGLCRETLDELSVLVQAIRESVAPSTRQATLRARGAGTDA